MSIKTIHHPAALAPLVSEAVAKFAGIELNAVVVDAAEAIVATTDAGEISGDVNIARTLVNSIPEASAFINDRSEAEMKLIDEWIAFAENALPATNAQPKPLSIELKKLDNHLAVRPLVAGYYPSLADLAIWAQLRILSGKNPNALKLLNQATNVARWFQFIESHSFVAAVVNSRFTEKKDDSKKPAKDASHASAEVSNLKSKLGCAGNFDAIKLTDAVDGAVVTRFPPEPSGYLHIGHIKAALLNWTLAEKYHGKMLLRFDDTNPSKEKVEYVESIKEDLQKIGIVPFKVSYTSDFFDQLLELGTEIIKRGKAYVDPTPHEEMKEGRANGIESVYRNNSIEENLRLWNEMQLGSPEGKKCLMRAKIDMQSLNKCLRDPGLYRVVDDTPHHRTGTKYKVYPLYDFACPIVDALEGVTHAMRSSEYHDRNPLYYWILEALSLRKVYIEDFSRLNFTYMVLSKRKLQWFVDTGKVDGWNSPSFPTIQGLLRRGLTVQALREFVLIQGASKNDVNMETNKMWARNRQILDPIVPRYTAIDSKNVVVRLSNFSGEPFFRSVPLHRKTDMGEKVIAFGDKVLLESVDAADLREGEEITLMNWGNIIIRTIERDSDANITGIAADLHLEGSFKDTEKKLTWIAAAEDSVPLALVEYDFLITKPKLGPEDELENVANPNISVTTSAIGQSDMRLLRKGDKIQLERRGYFIVDETPIVAGSAPIQLIMIPDGKTKSMSVIESKVDKAKGSKRTATKS